MTAVIIEAAINGVASKARNPHVPCEPMEIAADALACLSAGAAIVHNHIDQFGTPGPLAAARYLEGWRPVLARRPDAIRDFDYLGGSVRGVSFGLPPTPTALAAYLELLGDCPVPWAVAVIGGDVIETGMARLALERGGHLRVGLEDYAGARQPRNVELVEAAVALARTVGREVADTAQTVALLGLQADRSDRRHGLTK